MPWFAVKTLYRVFAQGKPRLRDDSYDSDGALVEERVIVVQADDYDEAILRAESDARAYECEFDNAYGQRVKVAYLEVCDAFACSFSGVPTDGSEVWSSVRRVPVSMNDEEIAREFLPAQEEPTGPQTDLRRKFAAVADEIADESADDADESADDADESAL